MSVAVSVRGQTVIPSKIRKRYHITPRTRLEFIDTGSEIVVVPIPDDRSGQSRGMLKGVSSSDLIRTRRQERRRDHGQR